jgi:hypothetical protein
MMVTELLSVLTVTGGEGVVADWANASWFKGIMEIQRNAIKIEGKTTTLFEEGFRDNDLFAVGILTAFTVLWQKELSKLDRINLIEEFRK